MLHSATTRRPVKLPVTIFFLIRYGQLVLVLFCITLNENVPSSDTRKTGEFGIKLSDSENEKFSSNYTFSHNCVQPHFREQVMIISPTQEQRPVISTAGMAADEA